MSKLRSSSIALLIGGASTLVLAALAASTLWRQRQWQVERAADEQENLAEEAASALSTLAASWDDLIAAVCDEELDTTARVRLLERAVPGAEWLIFEQRARVFPPREAVPAPKEEELEYFTRVEAALRRGDELPASEAAEWARTVWIAVEHPGLRSEAALVRSRALARAGELEAAEEMRTAAMAGPLSFHHALRAPAAFLAAYENWRASSDPIAARVALLQVLERAARSEMDPGLLRALASELASEDTALAAAASAAAVRCARLQELTRFALANDVLAMERHEDWIHVHWSPRGALRIAAALPVLALERLLPLAALENATQHPVHLSERAEHDGSFVPLPTPFDDLALGLAWTPRRESASAWIELALLLSVGAAAAIGLFAALRLARREALLAARQAEFTGNVAHELRTPLAALLLHAELLEGPAGTDAARRAVHLDVLRSEALRLTRLVDRVVALAAGRRPQAAASASLGEVLERVLDRASIDVTLRAEIALDLRVSDGEGTLGALSELVDNAQRHGAEPIEIEVIAVNEPSSKRAEVELRVLDRGAGIADQDRERIFERFERGDKARRDAVRGAGLGLALVKNFVAAAGGSLSCSARAGGGSCFSMRLPVVGPAHPSPPERPA